MSVSCSSVEIDCLNVQCRLQRVMLINLTALAICCICGEISSSSSLLCFVVVVVVVCLFVCLFVFLFSG